MAGIAITRNHSLPTAELKGKLEELQAGLKRDWGIESSWINDSTATIKGKGVKKGEVSFTDSTINISLTLGMMARAFSGKIQKKLESELDKIVGA